MKTVTEQLADALRTIDEHCQTGLNSSVYSHWSAALEDAMRVSREALAAYDAQRAVPPTCGRCNDECALEWADGVAPTFNRFDIAEAYTCLESDYNVGGWLRERPSNVRRRESCGVQLHRMKFRARPDLDRDTLTPNGRAIYDAAVRRLGLPA